jgi:tRNA-Thr(GGU) m(6)t(6)A37 methyltransferase TsaA
VNVVQIGAVRSAIRERKGMPPLGVPARVEIFERFAAGLLRFEKHSHIWVLAWLDRAEREVLQVTPRGVSDRSAAGLHGVFAVRSPARPNPLGLTACRVLERQGLSFLVDGLDFLDGTPVVDVKPYFVTRDLMFSAVSEEIGKPRDYQSMTDSLVLQAVRFHGEDCQELRRAVSIVARFRSEEFGLAEPEHWDVTAPAARPCMADALMGMTRVSLGRRTLRLAEEAAIEFRYRGRLFRYSVD